MKVEIDELKAAILTVLRQRAKGKAQSLKEAEILKHLAPFFPKGDLPNGGAFRNAVDELRNDYEQGKLDAKEYVLSSNNGYFLPVEEADFDAYTAEIAKRKDTAARRLRSAGKCQQQFSNIPQGTQIKIW